MKREEIESLIREIAASSRVIKQFGSDGERVLERYSEDFRKTRDMYIELLQQYRNQFNQVFLSAREMANEFLLFVENLNYKIDKLPFKTKEELEILASNGWYLDPEMPFQYSTRLAGLFLNGKNEEAENILQEFFNNRAGAIESRLINGFPKRRDIIKEAFEAHEMGLYALSIPVLLSQADGICKELLGLQLYKKTKGGKSTQIKDAIQSCEIKPILEPFLAPFLKPFPIIAGPNQRSKGELNRHAILHGEVVDYNTPKNSCKAISLLSFSEWIFSEGVERVN